MNLSEALKRIEDLEARVRQLEGRKVREIHHHYVDGPPYGAPGYYPPIPPHDPYRWTEFPPTITCSGGYGGTA